MGVQTMSSLVGGGGGGGGGAGGGGVGGVLSRQGSVYGLTLNEVESHLGEPLRSMNLEDLLRTVLPAAEPHAPGTGRKTVDEVWRDIESAGRGRQPTVGEMTLEDFLSRAGVPVDGAGGAVGGACGAGAHWLHQYHPPQQYVARPLPRPLGVGAGPVLDAVYHDGGGGGGGVFLSQVGGGRKRGAAVAVSGGGDGVVEKTVERRQKRMIKNRESAARSRARKQVPSTVFCLHPIKSNKQKIASFSRIRHACRPTPTSWRTRSRGWRRRSSTSRTSRSWSL
uniref:Uncharacterized protein n=1 Tax=Avena sativa TaxID=4498 RepID=A0ACD5YZS3_AVESA